MKHSRQKIKVKCNCGALILVRRDTSNANIKRNGSYLCHHCSTIKAGKDGKYNHNKKIHSTQSKKLWENKKFRDKITSTSLSNNTTLKYRKQQSQRTTKLWTDDAYRKSISNGVKTAMLSIDLRNRISKALCKKYHDDPLYRKAVGDAARERFNNDEYRKKMAIIRSNQPKISSIQKMLYSFLDDIGVNYYKEGPKTAIGWYVFDCMVPYADGGLLVECQGNYWHSLPAAISKDKAKFTYIDKYFPEYEIMYIWEHEFATNNRVLDRLKIKLGIDIQDIDFCFNDIIITENADIKETREFLDCYHYIGGKRGGRAIVAYLNGTIIACALFSKLLRQNMQYKNTIELSRFCIHPSYHKKNFASWFLSRCLKTTDKSVIAYADTTVGHYGTIYKAANFVLHHKVASDYWYVDNDGYVMHKKTLYNRAQNLKMTEQTFAEKYGYYKKYGGEKLCFIRQK